MKRTLIIAEHELRQRIVALNDPPFVAAVAIATESKREAAARRAAVVARLVLDLLPAAHRITFDFSGGETSDVQLISIRDAQSRLLVALDDRLDQTVHDTVEMDGRTQGTIEDLLDIAHNWDRTYFGLVDVEAPEWDLNQNDVYVLDLRVVLDEVATIDTELALKRTAPQHWVCPHHGTASVGRVALIEGLRDLARQLADLPNNGEARAHGEGYGWKDADATVALTDLIGKARAVLGLPQDAGQVVTDDGNQDC